MENLKAVYYQCIRYLKVRKKLGQGLVFPEHTLENKLNNVASIYTLMNGSMYMTVRDERLQPQYTQNIPMFGRRRSATRARFAQNKIVVFR